MSEDRRMKSGFAIVNRDGKLLVTTLRRRRLKAIQSILREGESWAMYHRHGYRLVQVSAEGVISAE